MKKAGVLFMATRTNLELVPGGVSGLGQGFNRRDSRIQPRIRGISYPLALDGQGNLATSEDEQLTKEQILSVLETKPGERVMRQSYGLPNLEFNSYQFSLVNNNLERTIRAEVRNVSYLRVIGDISGESQGLYRVRIEYSENGTRQVPIEIALQD